MTESYNAVKYTVYLNRLNHIEKRGKKPLQCYSYIASYLIMTDKFI